ncbi:MAG: peroxide stress protein YaaA [Weeksellaceae bacterium]|jgi:cytoplasmic iron level regulating protein YaaA (DUF328/UPF0246 family)|nr:peroxide stress protein YaaA [Weeksellaceae bacterium]
MKILLSPAKLMSLDSKGKWNKSTSPKFLSQAEVIMEKLQTLKPKDLEKLMSISPALAELNVERNLNWKPKTTTKESSPALFAFTGEVYKGLAAETLSEKAQTYLDENLIILSGLYGILRPSDKIRLYRLEMGTKLPLNSTKNLYEFWKETLTEHTNSLLKKNEVLLNLASVEYSKVLDDKKLKSSKIEVDFLDFKNGELKKVMVYFKYARGLMARYCAENNIKKLDDVKLFNEENYAFDEKLSTETKLVFVR